MKHKLGELVEEYTTQRKADWLALIGSGVMLMFFLVVLAGNVVSAAQQPRVNPAALAGVTITALAMLLGLLVVMFRSNLLRLWQNPRIAVHEKGIVFHTRQRELAFGWDGLDLRMLPVYVSRIGLYGLYADDRLVTKIGDEYHKAEQLIRSIVMSLSERHLPELRAALDRGEIVETGDLKVSQQGLHLSDGLLAWGNLRSLHSGMRFGQIIIEQHTPRRQHTLSILRLPHALTYLELVQQLILPAAESSDNPTTSTVAPHLEQEAYTSLRVFARNLLLALFIMVSFGYMLHLFSTTSNGDANRPPLSLTEVFVANIVVFIPFALFTAMLVFPAVQALWHNARFVASTEGLRYTSRKGESFWRWDEITHCVPRNGLRFAYVLYQHDTPLVTIRPHLVHFLLLMDAILKLMSEHWLPQYRARYEAGETLVFGQVQLDQRGIRQPPVELGWDTIFRCDTDFVPSLSQRAIVLYGDKGQTLLAISLSAIPNADTFLKLVQSIVDAHHKE